MSHCAGTKCQSWAGVYCHSWCEQCDWCVIPIARMAGSARRPSRRRVWFNRDATKSTAASALVIFKMYIWEVQQTLKANMLTQNDLWGKVPPKAGEGPCLPRDSAAQGIPCLPQQLSTENSGLRQEVPCRRLCWAPSCSLARNRMWKLSASGPCLASSEQNLCSLNGESQRTVTENPPLLLC